MKLLFDNTFGRPMVDYLDQTLRRWHPEPCPEVVHLQHRFPGRTADDVWVPKIIEENPLILSGDRGRAKPRLHDVCRAFNQKLVVVSTTILRGGNWGHYRCVCAAWPQLLAAYHAPPTRYRMTYSDPNLTHIKLVEKPYHRH